MPDPRFFNALGPIRLSALIKQLGLDATDGIADIDIMRVAPLAQAGVGDISFLSDPRHGHELSASKASACFVRAADSAHVPPTCVAVITAHPQAAYAKTAGLLFSEIEMDTAAPAIHPTAEIGKDVFFGHHVVIGAGARIGDRGRIGANTVIGPGVVIGPDAHIGAGVSIRHAVIGARVKILANAAIGEAGFGATADASGLIDIPQLGRVVLGDDVTLGACSTIDRGAWNDTVVEDQVKMDNLVQIAHNCHIGRGTVMAAYTGISGSVTIGQYVQLGGRAGVADHITIGDRARIGAAAGVIADVPAGETWAGYPAKPIRQWLRESASIARLAKDRSNQ